MINFEEACYIINKNITRTEKKIKTIDSLNSICSSNIYSSTDYPFFNNSAVDGYLISLNNVFFDKNLNMYYTYLSSEIFFSGDFFLNLEISTEFSYEICTGSAIPVNFNCVLAKENVYLYENKIFFSEFPKIYDNIRFKGEDFKKGDILVSIYEKINSLKIALLLTGGIDFIFVFSSPKILLLSTGDELISNEIELKEGKIFNSNIYMICNEIKKNFIFDFCFFYSHDNFENITKILSNFLLYDLVLILGGMGFGKHDFTRDALNKLEVNELFFLGNWKPGKPLYFGVKKGVFFFGLPGNPNSCYITFKIFIEYFIKNFMGKFLNFFFLIDFFPLKYFKKSNCLLFLHGFLLNKRISVSEKQNSNLINYLSKANVLILLDSFYDNNYENNLIKYIKI